MRVLTTEEIRVVSAAGGDDEFFEVIGEIMFYVCIEIIEQVIIELIIHGTANAIRGIHNYFYPPQTVVQSNFRPAAVEYRVA
jgi:hypothetical protein